MDRFGGRWQLHYRVQLVDRAIRCLAGSMEEFRRERAASVGEIFWLCERSLDRADHAVCVRDSETPNSAATT